MTRIDVAAADAAVRKMHGLCSDCQQQREQDEQLALNQSLGIPAQENIPLEKSIEPSAPGNLPAAPN